MEVGVRHWGVVSNECIDFCPRLENEFVSINIGDREFWGPFIVFSSDVRLCKYFRDLCAPSIPPVGV